jgi:hypothetical protein
MTRDTALPANLHEFLVHLESVQQWSRGSDRAQHVAWLAQAIDWELVAAVTMTWAAQDADPDDDVDSMMRVGLGEVSRGASGHEAGIVNEWRRSLGAGTCAARVANDTDARWLRQRLLLPAPPGVGERVRNTLSTLAEKGDSVLAVAVVDCGNRAQLIVGTRDGRLVPLLRETTYS